MAQETIELTEEQGNALFGGLEQGTIQEQAEVVDPSTENPLQLESEAGAEAIIEEAPVEQVEASAEVDAQVETKVEVVEDEVSVPSLVVQEQDEPAAEAKVEEPKVTKQTVRKYKDERHAALNKYIEENGSEGVSDFLRKYDSNFDSLSDLDLIKYRIESDPDNANMTPSSKKRLVDIELEKYGLDSDDPDDVAFGTDMLKRDASRYRKQLESEKNELKEKYKSELEITEDVLNDGPTEEEIQKQRDAMAKSYSEKLNPFVKDGKLKLSDKEGEINIPFENANDLVEAAMNPVGFLNKAVVNEGGEINFGLFAEIAAFIKNPGVFKSNLIKYGKQLGTTSLASTIKNAAPIGKGTQIEGARDVTPESDPIEFFKHATIVRR